MLKTFARPKSIHPQRLGRLCPEHRRCCPQRSPRCIHSCYIECLPSLGCMAAHVIFRLLCI